MKPSSKFCWGEFWVWSLSTHDENHANFKHIPLLCQQLVDDKVPKHMLVEIGFWCQAHDREGDAATADAIGGYADPLQLVDHTWAAASAALLPQLQWYLTDGAFVESHELAYSYCRFSDCVVAQQDPKVMGACTMTDGVYCWPEAYWHYVAHHHVRPPDPFLRHVEANFASMQQQRAAVSDNGDVLLLWDEAERRAVPMPSAMQEWITAHTTVQVHRNGSP
ncbi:hypothetical protein FI667_g10345, partial [Globisporangium splendens]